MDTSAPIGRAEADLGLWLVGLAQIQPWTLKVIAGKGGQREFQIVGISKTEAQGKMNADEWSIMMSARLHSTRPNSKHTIGVAVGGSRCGKGGGGWGVVGGGSAKLEEGGGTGAVGTQYQENLRFTRL